MSFILLVFLTIFPACFKDSPGIDTDPIDLPADAGLRDIDLWDPPVTAIHIDPLNTDDPVKDGSVQHPFSSFSEITWNDGAVYALRRGTTTETGTIMIFADNVTLASYGKGARPVIKSLSEDYAVSTSWQGGHNITIRDIEVHAPDAISSVIFRTNSTNGKVINVRLHGSEWGLRALNNIDGLYIYNTEIFDTADDGIFIRETRNIEIAHSHIHRVNRNWKPPSTPEDDASGDGIQLYLCNDWHVHHNIIDRSDTGNKFCFISNNPEQDNGIFEYNLLSGPRPPGYSIYIGDGRNIIIRYNYITGPSQSPLWSHASGLKIYYNIFTNISGPLLVSGSAEVYNNLFYNNAMGIEGGRITAKNNIFDLGAVDRPRFNVRDLTESNNLFVYGLPTRNSETGDPRFADPENGNFRLLPESDCIDKGADVNLKQDIEGNRVPAGSSPDIGPFEFRPDNRKKYTHTYAR
ncbi:MAG: right-handed parallel beta-helix repeat-containing protein [Bacteroidales bacterium]